MNDAENRDAGYKAQITKKDYLAAAIIGEAVAWLFILTAKGAQVPGSFLVFAKSYLPIAFPILSVVGLAAAGWLSRFLSFVLQAAKFVLVGALNTFIDIGILNLFILATGLSLGVPYIAFKGISFTVAVINSYFWNKYWTFEAGRSGGGAKEFGQFMVVSVVGLVINISSAGFVNNIIGPLGGISQQAWATVSAIVAVFIALIWNFLGYKFIVFKKQEVGGGM